MSEQHRSPVAFLGAGIMGFPMAANLARAGFAVRVWNRTAEKAAPLAEFGATVAASPADAASGAEFLITMLTDADAVSAAMEGDDGALSAVAPGATWVQMSTVGVRGFQLLAELAAAHGVGFVDAPVLGTRKPAEDGKLRILASGPADLLERCRSLWPPLGTPLDGLGEAGNGTRLKLAVNEWVLALNDATAASITLTQRLGLDGDLFLKAIKGLPTDSPYAHVKGAAMLAGEYAPSFTAASAAKDAHLIAEAAAEVGADTALIEAIRAHLDAVVATGHGAEDMAAVFLAHQRSG
ncbi:MAG: 3-hydroxyisobutyrate dehydrogenase [Pseudonocardiales bacterium]|jgi:3-hydroxyisobutyrate dehydrogenase|nr:3-hydroxyisobutyrate dehydrogenase [Pseudonocardiales bacterium]